MRFFQGLTCVLASAVVCMNSRAMGEECITYFGTYTGEKSKGIYISRFDPGTGRLTQPELAVEVKNPTYLALHPTKPFIYAVGEIATFAGRPTGAVSAFKIEGTSGRLTLVNQQPSQGKGPCHLSLDSSGKCVLVANYGSGSVSALPILSDGSLGPAASAIQHEGSSVNPKRQEGPHAHQAIATPDDRLALVCDLGLDQVRLYKLDAAKALLEPNDPPFAAVQPGSGPRHVAFRPDGKFLYLINELNSTMTTFAYDKRAAKLTFVDAVSTLPSGYKGGDNWCAAVGVHPNSKFVYGSNRGDDSIVVFADDARTGKLTLVQHVPSGGKYPRFFAIHPSGKWLLSLNQNSGDIVVFAIDPTTGKLTETGSHLSLGSPVCAVFLPANRK